VENAVRGRGAVLRRASADRVEHDRNLPRGRRAARKQHRLDPMAGERADVEDERRRDARHLLDLFACMRHYR